MAYFVFPEGRRPPGVFLKDPDPQNYCRQLSPDQALQCTRNGANCSRDTFHMAHDFATGEELGEWFLTDKKVDGIYDRLGKQLATMPATRRTNLGAGAQGSPKAAPAPIPFIMTSLHTMEKPKKEKFVPPTEYEPVYDLDVLAPDLPASQLKGLPTLEELNRFEQEKKKKGG